MGYLIITISILVFLVISFLLGLLVYYWYFAKDKPNAAWVFVDIAGRYVARKGKLVNQTSDGELFQYYDCDGEQQIIAVPNIPKYFPIKYWKHKRVIGVLNGNIVASPLGNQQPEEETGKKTLLKDLALSHIGSGMIKAMSSTKTNIAMIIMIIVIVAMVIGGSLYYYNESNSTTMPTTNQELPPSGEIGPK